MPSESRANRCACSSVIPSFALCTVEWLEHVMIEGTQRRGVLLAHVCGDSKHHTHHQQRKRWKQRHFQSE